MMQLTAVRFKRTATSQMENGLMINGDRIIVDMKGKVVKAPIWDWWDNSVELSLVFRPQSPTTKGGRRRKS